jgi:hypothetical protein
MGGGLNLTSKNADCFALMASTMYWMDHFGGAVPGDGRPLVAAEGLTVTLVDGASTGSRDDQEATWVELLVGFAMLAFLVNSVWNMLLRQVRRL